MIITKPKGIYLLYLLFFLFSQALLAQQSSRLIVETQVQSPDNPELWHEYLDTALSSSELVGSVRRFRPTRRLEQGTDGSEPTTGTIEQTNNQSAISSQPYYRVRVRVLPNNPREGRTTTQWEVVRLTGDSALESQDSDRISGEIQGISPRARDLAEFWWIPLIQAFEDFAEIPEATPFLDSQILIRGIPGTRIVIEGRDELVLNEEGIGVIGLENFPSTLDGRATLTGYESQRFSFPVTSTTREFFLELQPRIRWTLDGAMYMAQFPELLVSYRLTNELFLRLQIQQYLFGLYFPQRIQGWFDGLEPPPNPPLFVSEPVLLPGLMVGVHFLNLGSQWRLYGLAGGFLRLVVAPEIQGILDPIVPWGVHGALGLEHLITRRSAFFFELGANLYFLDNPLVLFEAATAGSSSDKLFGLGTITSFGLLDAPVFRLGVRFGL